MATGILKNNKEILLVCDLKDSKDALTKEALLKENASPGIISKNLAELKANKVSLKKTDEIVLGADSVIDLDGELISKPKNREEALLLTNVIPSHPRKLLKDEDRYSFLTPRLKFFKSYSTFVYLPEKLKLLGDLPKLVCNTAKEHIGKQRIRYRNIKPFS